MSQKRHYQKAKQPNPAVRKQQTVQKIESALHNARRGGIEWACLAYEVISLMVLHDKFNITDKNELKRYCSEMGNLSDSITKEYATLSDFVVALKEESGFTLTEDELAMIDPSLAGFLKDPSSEKS